MNFPLQKKSPVNTLMGKTEETIKNPSLSLYIISKISSLQNLIHHNKMAKTSSHDKKMKNLMTSKIFMDTVKPLQLKSIDHASHGVDHTSGKQPSKCYGRELIKQGRKHDNTYPAHGDIDERRKPFGAGYPAAR